MGRLRLIVACVLSLVLFSCTKTVLIEDQVIVPPMAARLINYDESRILRVPGNYQEWNVAAAPKIISVNGDGEYEGYINFTLANTEFWLVKGTGWDNVTTYNETGNYTFGHNGNVFTPPSGAGVYKVNASTNTFKWSCIKADEWSINGTAVGETDAGMKFDAASMSWCITRNLSSGDFIFRANKTNDIVFGHNAEAPSGMLAYNAAKIHITKSGNYTILLCLQTAGGYRYGLKRNF